MSILLCMSKACPTCRRPVPLSADEVAVMKAAATGRAGVRLVDLTETQAACVKALIRLGYLVKAANDDGPRGRSVFLTDHGWRRLAQG